MKPVSVYEEANRHQIERIQELERGNLDLRKQVAALSAERDRLRKTMRKAAEAVVGGGGKTWAAPAFTRSLDAAMLLVPKGEEWSWEVGSAGDATITYHDETRLHWERAHAATPALALTAAALLARAEQEDAR